jgi:hypothetical protein
MTVTGEDVPPEAGNILRFTGIRLASRGALMNAIRTGGWLCAKMCAEYAPDGAL